MHRGLVRAPAPACARLAAPRAPRTGARLVSPAGPVPTLSTPKRLSAPAPRMPPPPGAARAQTLPACAAELTVADDPDLQASVGARVAEARRRPGQAAGLVPGQAQSLHQRLCLGLQGCAGAGQASDGRMRSIALPIHRLGGGTPTMMATDLMGWPAMPAEITSLAGGQWASSRRSNWTPGALATRTCSCPCRACTGLHQPPTLSTLTVSATHIHAALHAKHVWALPSHASAPLQRSAPPTQSVLNAPGAHQVQTHTWLHCSTPARHAAPCCCH